MAIDYKLLGNRIKKQRLVKGTTQEHFAEHMDVSVGYISQMERGITKISLERLVHIAKLNGRICGAKRSHSVSEQPNCYQSV